jgi:UDP-glucose:(heptosyl)LPS alpha-1,3-glucosyltransferase
MKLALIRRQYAATGGAERYLQRLAGALVAAGHQVHVLASAWQGEAPGVVWRPVPSGGTRATRPLEFALAVLRLLDQEPFDVVFSLERTLRQDVYRAGDGVHRVWLERREQFGPWWRRLAWWSSFHRHLLRLESWTLDPNHTGRVIVNSEMVRGEIHRCFGYPLEQIHLVRNGVDPGFWRGPDRAEARRRLGLSAEGKVVLFVGSGWERKGLGYALEAFARARQSMVGTAPPRFLVVGKGRPPWRSLPGVVFLGPLDDVRPAYAAADVFLFLPIYEPAANVCGEALAAGVPVITSATNGAAEIVQPGLNGEVVASPDDVETASQALRTWLQWQGGPVRASVDLSLERNVTETLNILEEVALAKRA